VGDGKGSGSFLKKRTKKLLFMVLRVPLLSARPKWAKVFLLLFLRKKKTCLFQIVSEAL
jgi:hypothetical protein